MTCDSPVRECFEWHIKPHLDKPRPNVAGDSVRALCPVHEDRTQSFSISIGGRRFIWQCFAHCDKGRIRAALIDRGVPPGCLPRVAKESEELLGLLRSVIYADTADHAGVRLRAAAVLEGFADLPRGRELERLAGMAHVNKVTAYRAKKSPPPAVKPDNPSSYAPSIGPVKSRRSEASPEVA